MSATVQDLEDLVAEGKIAAKDKSFAMSLVKQHKSKGSLSDKQIYWVNKLVDAALSDTPKECVNVGSLTAIEAMFDTARKHVKYPNIVIGIPDHGLVKLYQASSASTMPGALNVVSHEGHRPWWGRVRPDGSWRPSPKTQENPALNDALVDFLTMMLGDPEQTVRTYGQLQGRCCFCNSELEDETSVAVGYGPTCAKNYGLPWGKKVAQFKAEQVYV